MHFYMLDCDLTESGPVLGRAYFHGLLGGATALAFYCLLNILTDPGGDFGLSGRFSFNQAPPSEAIVRGQAGGNPVFYARAIRESNADVFLFGTSRVSRGFDICGQPNILRIGGNAWGISQLAQAQALVLDSRNDSATLLIEIGLPQDEQDEQDGIAVRPGNIVYAALSLENAFWSLQTITASRASRPLVPTYTRCAPVPSAPPDWNGALKALYAEQKIIDPSPKSLRRGRDNVLEMADEADRICARNGVRHRLIYFSLPATPAQIRGQQLDLLFKTNSQEIADRFARRVKTSNGCSIRYLNFTRVPPGDAAEQKLWQSRDQWWDYTHYSPRLGSIALRELLTDALERGSEKSLPKTKAVPPS